MFFGSYFQILELNFSFGFLIQNDKIMGNFNLYG